MRLSTRILPSISRVVSRTSKIFKASALKPRYNFDEALAHGAAFHECTPFRIQTLEDGEIICQAGEPFFTGDGVSVRDSEGYLVMRYWHEVSLEQAKAYWPFQGWLLE